MNLGTLIGLLLGTALIGSAAFMQSASSGLSLTTLIDVTSLLIVVGGSLAATAIAFKMKDVIRRHPDKRFCILESLPQITSVTLNELTHNTGSL